MLQKRRASGESASWDSQTRLAVVMPRNTDVWGGVQRFAASIVPELEALSNVTRYTLHAGSGQARSLAAMKGSIELAGLRFAPSPTILFTTFHLPCAVPGIPTFGFIHDLRQLRERPTRLRPAIHGLVARSWKGVFVPSQHVAGDVSELLGVADPVVVPEGLDHLDHLRQPGAARDVLAVLAGPAPHKRAELGIRAALSAGALLGVRPTVLGELRGPEGEADLSLDGSMTVVRQPDDEQLAHVLNRTRVLIAPTRYEGFGLAVGEALRFGVPVVYGNDSHLEPLVRGAGVSADPTVSAFAAAAVKAWREFDDLHPVALATAAPLTWRAAASAVLAGIARRVPSAVLRPEL